MTASPDTLFTFDTTHHALWAEQIALEQRLGAQVVPAPAAAHAKCGLALECLQEDVAALAGVLEAAGVPYSLFVRTSGDAAGG